MILGTANGTPGSNRYEPDRNYVVDRVGDCAGEFGMARASSAHRERTGGVVDRSADVKILAFYGTAGEIREGDRELVCYGVQNARAVRMEPPIEALTPALTRCFWADPHGNTQYKLMAEGFDGRQVSESFAVRVKPALPSILFFAASHKAIQRGDAVTICYGVAHADSVELKPIGWELPPIARNCARFYPKITRDYTLVAHGTEGLTDRQEFAVGVR